MTAIRLRLKDKQHAVLKQLAALPFGAWKNSHTLKVLPIVHSSLAEMGLIERVPASWDWAADMPTWKLRITSAGVAYLAGIEAGKPDILESETFITYRRNEGWVMENCNSDD